MMSKLANFSSPHCHIQSLDTASLPEAFAERELELGTGTLTTTDHGSMAVCRKVYDLAHEKGLTPILGLEAYFRDDDCSIIKPNLAPDMAVKEYMKYQHLTIHYLDQAAYETGVRVLSRASLTRMEKHGSEEKPLFNWADLQELGTQNTIFTSGCLIGMVQRFLMQHKRPDLAEQYYCKLRSLVKPGSFYVEIFPHVCDRNWDSGVRVTYADGTIEKFQVHKQLQTDKWKGKARDIANKWKPERDSNAVLEQVMDNKVWTPRAEKKVIKDVKSYEDYIINECCPEWPDGDLQLHCNKFMLRMAMKYGDKVLISDDAHFATPDEKIVQDVRLQATGGSWRFHTSYHRMGSEQAFAYFSDKFGMSEKVFCKLVDNNQEWASRFKGFEFKDRMSLPTKFYPPDTFSHTMKLLREHGRMQWNNPQWTERLAQEIKLLHKNGTTDWLPYFFLDEEVCREAAKRGILTGPGRGSAAGLLLAYCLGITHANPLRYGLSMDRFMTIDRIHEGKKPDIDQDLESREWLLDPKVGYLKERFGDCVVQVSTDTTLKLRSSVKDVARITHGGRVPQDVEILTKKFMNAPQGVTDREFVFGYERESDHTWIKGSIEYDPALQEYVQKYPQDWEIAQKCLGLTRQKSRHACAYLITNEPVSNFIPLTQVDGIPVTQYTANYCEEVGAIKMDFLGVNSLKDISACIRLIQGRDLNRWWDAESTPSITGVPNLRVVPFDNKLYDVWDLPADPAVFADIRASKTETVFQFDTPGVKKWLRAFDKPGKEALKSIEDLAAFTALDRPGPLDYMVLDGDGNPTHNMLIEFAHRATGETTLGHVPILAQMFMETHGIIVFQEQLTRVFKEVGETTGVQAEAFRSHIGKKQMAKVYKDKALFMPKAIEKLGAETAEELWKSMESFGQYGFNRSHAVCYVILGYACAWLKHHYPLEWWTAVLSNADRAEINEKFWRHCGHLIELPDLAFSTENFQIQGDKIRAPVGLLEGVGPKAQEQINALRPFSTIEELCSKIEAWRVSNAFPTTNKKGEVVTKKATTALNAGVMKKFIVSGVADSLFPSDSSTADKIQAYYNATAAAQNRKVKKTEVVDPKWLHLTQLQGYLIRKTVLPAYSVDIRGMVAAQSPHNIKRGETRWEYHLDEKNVLQILDVEEFQQISAADYIMPGGIRAAIACYVVSDVEQKWVKKTESGKEEDRYFRKMLIDLEGLRVELVKWPDRGAKRIGSGFPSASMAGCGIVMLVSKYTAEKPWTCENALVIEHPIEDLEEEESSK
jgi:DNA polymerase III alpha subunit